MIAISRLEQYFPELRKGNTTVPGRFMFPEGTKITMWLTSGITETWVDPYWEEDGTELLTVDYGDGTKFEICELEIKLTKPKRVITLR
jgi:hypothetical protein